MNKDDAKITLPDGRVAYDAVKLASIETEGVFLKDVVGKTLRVRTRNTVYEFLVKGPHEAHGRAIKEDGTLPKYLSKPVDFNINGSTWGGSMLKVGYVGVGMHMEFYDSEQPVPITTSQIQSIAIT